MSKTTLPVDFTDDVLNASMNGKRRYSNISNDDGTYSMEDVTAYDKVGSDFGASVVNEMCNNINESFDRNKMLKTKDELNALTQEGYGVDALLVKDVTDSLGGLSFGYDETTQKYGYYKKEADTDVFVPFSNAEIFTESFTGTSKTFIFDKPIRMLSVLIRNGGVSRTYISDFDVSYGYGLKMEKVSDTEFTVSYGASNTFDAYYMYQ